MTPGNHDARSYNIERLLQKGHTYSQQVGQALFISCFLLEDHKDDTISTKEVDRCIQEMEEAHKYNVEHVFVQSHIPVFTAGKSNKDLNRDYL